MAVVPPRLRSGPSAGLRGHGTRLPFAILFCPVGAPGEASGFGPEELDASAFPSKVGPAAIASLAGCFRSSFPDARFLRQDPDAR